MIKSPLKLTIALFLLAVSCIPPIDWASAFCLGVGLMWLWGWYSDNGDGEL